jgi:hypothetical protein
MSITDFPPPEAKSVVETVDVRTLGLYGISMSDFLAYVRKRRAELQKELADLETAERVFKGAAEAGDATQVSEAGRGEISPALTVRAVEWAARPKTIKEMVLRLLTEAYPSGLTALEILEGVQKRWMPGLERTSLSPQLTRLKNDALVINRVGKWFSADAELARARVEESPTNKTIGAPSTDEAPK